MSAVSNESDSSNNDDDDAQSASQVSPKPRTISLVLDLFEDKKELIRDFKAYVNDGAIHYGHLINELKKIGYGIENSTVSYLNCSVWAKCDPQREELNDIPLTSLNNSRLFLRIQQNAEGVGLETREEKKANQKKESKKKRTKERTIKYVIEKVLQWRNLYKGIGLDGKSAQKISLDDAAKKVGISKKSLDDYLLQLRAARNLKFDFNKHQEKKIGYLRSYVKVKQNPENAHNDDVVDSQVNSSTQPGTLPIT